MKELETIVEKMCKDMGIWSAAIMTPDMSQDALICKAGFNLPEDWAALTNPFDESTLNGKSYMNDETIINNALNITTVRGAPTVHLIAGIMIVPIKKEGEVVGTLEIMNDNPDLLFEEKELELAQNTAKQLGRLL